MIFFILPSSFMSGLFLKGARAERLLCVAEKIPMTQTHTWASSDNRRIWLYTSVCHSPPLWCLLGTVRYWWILPHLLDTAVSLFRHHPRLFCLTHQKSVVFFFLCVYYVCVFNSKLFNLVVFFFCCLLSLSFSLSVPLVWLVVRIKERVKTKPSLWLHTKGTWSRLNATTRSRLLIFINFSIIFTQFGLSTGCFSFR